MSLTKKITSLVLALMLAVSFSIVASAAEVPSGSVAIGSFTGGTVTINASNADDTFALYKVVDITYDAATNVVSYAWSTAAASYVATLTGGPTIETYQNWATDSAEVKSFLGGFAAYVKANSVAADYTVAANNSVATVENAAIGQYMVLGTGSATGAYIYQIMTATFAPDSDYNVNTAVTLSSKTTLPTIAKGVDDRQVAIGDTATYTITVTVPTYPEGATNTVFSVTDAIPAELDNVTTVSVKDGNGADVAYTPSANGTGWEFAYNDIKAISTIVITYTAKVNDTAVPGTAIVNTATLEYSNDPYGDKTHEISDTESLYTYGIEIVKVDKENNSLKLEGVTFQIKSGDTVIGTITTNAEGKASFKGLDVGTYTLVETVTKTGYILDATPIEIVITDADVDGIVDTDAGTAGYVTKTITNTKGDFELPSTGGMGTWIFTISGLAIMVAAAAVLVVYKKKHSA